GLETLRRPRQRRGAGPDQPHRTGLPARRGRRRTRRGGVVRRGMARQVGARVRASAGAPLTYRTTVLRNGRYDAGMKETGTRLRSPRNRFDRRTLPWWRLQLVIA